MNENDFYSLVLFSILLFWTGGFVLVYGLRAARSAAFPLAFLLFAVPIPSTVLERIILFLQWGSTAAAHGLFALTGVPFLREGTVFTLPTVSIEVAPQCSGIRSTIALLITGVLGSKLFLQSPWRRVALVLSVFPITIFKNGIRITALTLMGAYVDVKILTKSALHSNGGVLFFALALLLLGVVLWMLRKTESGRGSPEHRVSH